MPGTLGLLKKLKVLMLDDNLLECLPKGLLYLLAIYNLNNIHKFWFILFRIKFLWKPKYFISPQQ